MLWTLILLKKKINQKKKQNPFQNKKNILQNNIIRSSCYRYFITYIMNKLSFRMQVKIRLNYFAMRLRLRLRLYIVQYTLHTLCASECRLWLDFGC